MKNKIPTAEELSKRYGLSAKGALWTDTVRAFAIEFAKLHVEAQTEAILKITHKNGIPRIVDNKESILNAYPLTNIK